MSESTELKVADQTTEEERKFELMQRQAKAFVQSGYFTIQNISQGITKMMAGNELGLPPLASINGIHLIQTKMATKLTLSSGLISSLIESSPNYSYIVGKSTDTLCEIKFYDNRKELMSKHGYTGTSTFTIEEAAKAQLTGKDVWKKYPSDMLFARALTRGARRYCSGIFGGSPVYTPEELGVTVDQSGNIVDEPKEKKIKHIKSVTSIPIHEIEDKQDDSDIFNEDVEMETTKKETKK